MNFFDSIGNTIGNVVGGITGANQQAEAIQAGAELQAGAAQAGVEETRRQFDKLVELMAPFVGAGTKSLGAQSALLGLEGPEAQRAAITGIGTSPTFQALQQQGETSILQNAAATGGLRGGNTQAALAQFSLQLLNQLIQQQFANLGGLTSIGQASAAGQGAAGQQFGADVSNLLQNAATARAGGLAAVGGVPRQAFSDLLNITQTGAKAAGLFL